MLNYLLTLHFRNHHLYKKELENLIAGYEGERRFIELADQFSQKKLSLIWDYTFDIGTYTQIDVMILTQNSLNVYEIKNYHAQCESDGVTFKYNDHVVANNPYTQCRTATSRLTNLLRREGINIDVVPHLVLIHPNCQMKLANLENDISTLMMIDIPKHIYQLQPMEPRTADRILSTLNKYRCVSPYQPHTQYPFDLNQITPGIFCPKCGSYQIGIHNRCIVCQNCNSQEEKSSAVKRLIAECATLFPEQTFQKKDLMYLANHQVGRTTLHFYTRNLCRKLAQGLYQYENSHQLPQQLKLYRAHINDR